MSFRVFQLLAILKLCMCLISATQVENTVSTNILEDNCSIPNDNKDLVEYCVIDTDTSCGVFGGQQIPCLAQGRKAGTKLHDKELVNILERLCPELMPEDGTDPVVCCSEKGLMDLQAGYKSLGLFFEKCPSCWHSLRKNFCQHTCSPKQNKFVRVANCTDKSDDGDIPEGRKRVTEINYYINTNYVDGVFDSCQHVSNGTILPFLCGTVKPGEKCDGQHFFNFLGANGPYLISYVYTNETSLPVGDLIMEPMNETTVPCNQLAPGHNTTCNCEDCKPACDNL